MLIGHYVLMAAGPAPSGEAAFWGITTWDLQEEASASSGHQLPSRPPPLSIKDNPLMSEGLGGLGSWTPPSPVPRWGGLQAWAESGQRWGIRVHYASTQHPAPVESAAPPVGWDVLHTAIWPSALLTYPHPHPSPPLQGGPSLPTEASPRQGPLQAFTHLPAPLLANYHLFSSTP